jgi:hypothetical protein
MITRLHNLKISQQRVARFFGYTILNSSFSSSIEKAPQNGFFTATWLA